MMVRDLPETHDSGNLMQAMSEARHPQTPALGLFYQELRPTLNDGLNKITERAQSAAQ
jgi:hypothetical protein